MSVYFERQRLESFCCLLCSVILSAVAVSFYFDLILLGPVFYCQGPFFFCDLVVVSACSLIQLVCECVLAAADQCLCAGDIVCGAFSCYESVAAYCYVCLCILCQCVAVVFFFTVCGG